MGEGITELDSTGENDAVNDVNCEGEGGLSDMNRTPVKGLDHLKP